MSSPVPQSIDALALLQRQFISRLRGQPDGNLQQRVDAGRVSREVGLRIYVNAYTSRLREALRNDHGVLAAYLGDALWEALCAGYIAAHPSRVRSLRDFGQALPDYLAHAHEFRALPQVAELARFERALLDSFDAADAGLAAWDALQARAPHTWPALQPRVHPSVRLHAERHGSVAIWQAIKAGDAPPVATSVATGHWLLWRDLDRIGRFRSIDADAAVAMAHCRDGGDFAGLCALLAETHPVDTVPALALGMLQEWCVAGWISGWD